MLRLLLHLTPLGLTVPALLYQLSRLLLLTAYLVLGAQLLTTLLLHFIHSRLHQVTVLSLLLSPLIVMLRLLLHLTPLGLTVPALLYQLSRLLLLTAYLVLGAQLLTTLLLHFIHSRLHQVSVLSLLL